jgi:predicted transcriptional regulator
MQVREVMTEECRTLPADATIQQAAALMREWDIGMLPVREMSGTLIGTVTDRDIVVHAIAEGQGADTPVKDVMHHGIVYCYDDQDLVEAAQLMKGEQIRRLVVCNRQDQPVGLLALGDIALHGGNETAAKVLQEVSKPA